MYTYKKEDFFHNGIGLAVCHPRMTAGEKEHLHEFTEIVYVAEGSGIHGINGVEYRVQRGSLLFINYRQSHYFKTDAEMRFYNILLDPEWISERLIEQENAFELLTLTAFSDFQAAVDTDHPLVQFHGADRTRLERLIREMEAEQKGKEIGYETVLKAQTNILLTMIFRKMSRASESREQFRLDGEFLDYIRAHCAEKLSLEELSRSCFYNPSYFSRIFKEHYGMTLTEFINQSRLERAMQLLRETKLAAEEVAEQAGFSSRSAFYKSLKEKTGLTPQAYRTVNQK